MKEAVSHMQHMCLHNNVTSRVHLLHKICKKHIKEAAMQNFKAVRINIFGNESDPLDISVDDACHVLISLGKYYLVMDNKYYLISQIINGNNFMSSNIEYLWHMLQRCNNDILKYCATSDCTDANLFKNCNNKLNNGQRYNAVVLQPKQLLMLLLRVIPIEDVTYLIDKVVSGKCGEIDFDNNPANVVHHMGQLFEMQHVLFVACYNKFHFMVNNY